MICDSLAASMCSSVHRDFLGACLGCGISRQKVGDILVQGERGAQILVDKELVQFLVENLTQAREHACFGTLIANTRNPSGARLLASRTGT